MSPALPHRPSSHLYRPTRVVRDVAAALRRREQDDLRQRAVWVDQARHTPALADWIDEADPLDDPVRGPARIGLARRR